jgi:hypothetical protein
MKIFIAIGMLLTSVVSISIGQSTNTENELGSMYLRALEEYVKSYEYFNDDSTIYFDQQFLSLELPTRIEGVELIKINGNNYKKIYKANSRKLIHTRFGEVKLTGDLLLITIIPYQGTWSNKHLDLALSDWYTCEFKYNQETNSWDLNRSFSNGI